MSAGKTGVGTPAHKTLVAQVKADKVLIVKLLEEGSREFDALRAIVESYISHQTAADIVSGQS